MRTTTPTGFRTPWEPPFFSEPSIAILRQQRRRDRHPHPGVPGAGNTYSTSRVGHCRGQAALALEAAGRFRREVALKYDSGRPSGAVRYGDRWYKAWRDACGWRARAEASAHRSLAHDVAAVSGHRLKTVGDQLSLLELPRRRTALDAWSVWEWDKVSLGHGMVADRLLHRGEP